MPFMSRLAKRSEILRNQWLSCSTMEGHCSGLASAYQWALDNAVLQIQSGAISYNQAISGAVKQLADSGIKTAEYESGHMYQIDVAVRRAIMSGINQLCQQYSEQGMDYLETDLVEVSAHIGARNTGTGSENHESWQGKIYRWNKKPKQSSGRYPDFIASTGYGTGPGLGRLELPPPLLSVC